MLPPAAAFVRTLVRANDECEVSNGPILHVRAKLLWLEQEPCMHACMHIHHTTLGRTMPADCLRCHPSTHQVNNCSHGTRLKRSTQLHHWYCTDARASSVRPAMRCATPGCSNHDEFWMELAWTRCPGHSTLSAVS